MSKAPYYNAVAVRDTMLAIATLPMKISAAEGMVLMVIAMHTGERTWLSFNTIGREAHMNRSTAFRIVNSLREKKLVDVPGRHSSRANFYNLTLPSYANCDIGKSPIRQNEHSRIGDLHTVVGDLHILECANCDSDVCNLPTEVVQEPEPESIHESEQGSSTGELAASTPRMIPVPVEQGERVEAPATTAPVVSIESAPASTPKAAPEPERILTNHFFVKLGSPQDLRGTGVGTAWRTAFRTALQQHSKEDLRGAIDWTFGDDFWPKYVMGAKDPLDYFMSKLETIMKQYRGARLSDENAKNKAVAKAATQITNGKPAYTPSPFAQRFIARLEAQNKH